MRDRWTPLHWRPGLSSEGLYGFIGNANDRRQRLDLAHRQRTGAGRPRGRAPAGPGPGGPGAKASDRGSQVMRTGVDGRGRVAVVVVAVAGDPAGAQAVSPVLGVGLIISSRSTHSSAAVFEGPGMPSHAQVHRPANGTSSTYVRRASRKPHPRSARPPNSTSRRLGLGRLGCSTVSTLRLPPPRERSGIC
jgi:hypothetical protein